MDRLRAEAEVRALAKQIGRVIPDMGTPEGLGIAFGGLALASASLINAVYPAGHVSWRVYRVCDAQWRLLVTLKVVQPLSGYASSAFMR